MTTKKRGPIILKHYHVEWRDPGTEYWYKTMPFHCLKRAQASSEDRKKNGKETRIVERKWRVVS